MENKRITLKLRSGMLNIQNDAVPASRDTIKITGRCKGRIARNRGKAPPHYEQGGVLLLYDENEPYGLC